MSKNIIIVVNPQNSKPKMVKSPEEIEAERKKRIEKADKHKEELKHQAEAREEKKRLAEEQKRIAKGNRKAKKARRAAADKMEQEKFLEIFRSADSVKFVADIGKYQECSTCGNPYKRIKGRYYDGKSKQSVRFCPDCSKLYFQFSWHKLIPDEIYAKAELDYDLLLAYSRIKLSQQIIKDRDYFASNMDIPLHVDFGFDFCSGDHTSGGGKTIQVPAYLNAYDIGTGKFIRDFQVAYMCVKCGRIQLSRAGIGKHIHDFVYFHNIYGIYGEKLGSANLEEFKERLAENNKREIFDFSSQSNYLSRCDGDMCSEDYHKLQEIEGVVKVLNIHGEIIEVIIPVGKCIACNRYYIRDNCYKKLREQGMILCKVEDKKNPWSYSDSKLSEMNQESILHMYGYNVSSTAGLTDEQRQTILMMLVTRRVLSRFQIIDHLEFLINLNQYKSSFSQAICKWKSDIEFLDDLKLDLPVEEISELRVIRTLDWRHKSFSTTGGFHN